MKAKAPILALDVAELDAHVRTRICAVIAIMRRGPRTPARA